MPAANGAHGYSEALLFLATAGVIVPVFRRLHLSPVLGFLLAGIVLGPFGFGSLEKYAPWLDALTISNVEEVAHLAELGVVFLMFMIGLELSWERLVRMRRLVFGFGALQVVTCAAALGAIAFALGQATGSAIVLGSALALSSTAIVLPTLAERKRLHLSAGRTSFAVLLFQDLAVAPLLFMVAMFGARDGGAGLETGLLHALAPAVLAVAALVVLGRLVLRPLFHQVATTGSRELFMAACLLVIIGTGYLTALSGQSMALGAFIAGLLLAETEYRHQIEVLIDPFKGLLLGLFFLSVGTQLNVAQILSSPEIILGLAAGFVLVKALVLMLLGRLIGLAPATSREVALTLAPGGEFAFVMLGAAMAAHVVPAASGMAAMTAVTLSMLAIPLLVRLAERLAPRHAGKPDLTALAPPPHDGTDGVLIAGFGRTGRLVGEMLTRHGVPFLAIDSDARLVARERKAGTNIHYGDAAHPELLRRCGVGKARALVATMDSHQAVELVVSAGRAERADLIIVARARDAQHAKKLYRLGATDAMPELIEVGLQLCEAVLTDIGVPAGQVIASIHGKRDEFRALLQPKAPKVRQRRAIRASNRLSHRPARSDQGEPPDPLRVTTESAAGPANRRYRA